MRFSDLPRMPPLFVRFAEEPCSVSRFLPDSPRPDTLARRGRQVAAAWGERAGLPGGIAALLGPDAPEGLSGRLSALCEPGSVAVIARVPSSPLGGPLAHLCKVLTVVRVAELLQADSVPAVPLVVATECDDKECCRDLVYVDAAGGLRRISPSESRARDPSGLLNDIQSALNAWSGDDGLAPLRRSLLEAGGSSAFLRDLLEAWQCPIVAVPGAASDRLAAHSVVLPADAAERAADSCRELSQAGFGPATLPADYGSWVASSVQWLAAWALPAAVVVVDPEECVEAAVWRAIWAGSGQPFPVVWPRASATLLDARSRKTMEKYGLRLDALFEGPGAVSRLLGQESSAAETVRQLDRLRADAESRLIGLKERAGTDERLRESIGTAAEGIAYQISRLRERFEDAHEQRRGAVARQIERLCNAVAPGGELQESTMATFYFLYRFSRGVVASLHDRLFVAGTEHQILEVE